MTLLLAAVLSIQQSDEELRALVERFNSAIQDKNPEGQKLPWDEVRQAGPAILKHLAAAFPGRRVTVRRDDGSVGWEGEGEYPLARMMVFGFKEKALPHLITLTKDPEPAKARIAAALLRHYPVKEIVGPLIDFSKSRDLDADPQVKWTVNDVLVQATFLTFNSIKDLEAWYETAKARSQTDWLREAIDHAEPARIAGDYAVKGMQRLLDRHERLKSLLHCFVDLDWREAGFALYGATGHQLDPRGKNLWDPATMTRERASWGEFRKLGEWEQQIEIALHSADREGVFHTSRMMTPQQAGEVLVDHADKAFDYLEKMAPRHTDCPELYSSLVYVATSKNWDGVAKLAPILNPKYAYVHQIMEMSRHPSMTDKMFEMVLAGAVERGPFRTLMTEFPKRARRDMVPKILESLSTATDRTRETLLSALATVGDPRGWDIRKKEIFSDPKRINQTIEMLEKLPGDDAVAELRRILREFPAQTTVARILADRGDGSGIPALVRGLETAGMNETKMAFLCLSQIRGRWPTKDGRPMDPWPGREAIRDFTDWWDRNKSRSRMDWLLESLDEGPESGTPWGPLTNPLVFFAKEELKDISKDQPEVLYRKAVAARVRAWVAKTGFTFNKDTVRVPYWRWMEEPRR